MQDKKMVFLNEKVAKKLFKNEKYGKILSAKIISDVIGANFEEVYDNIKLSTDEIAFSALTVDSTADAIYYDDTRYFNIELNFYNNERKKRQLMSYTYQLFLGQIHTYNDYMKIKKIVQISIDSYDIFNKNEFIYNIILMEEKHKIPFTDLIQLIHVNIDFLRKLDYTKVVEGQNKLMKDLYFFICNDDNRLNSFYREDNLMEEIINEAKQIAGTEKMNLYLTDEEIFRQDFEDGYKDGYESGLQNGYENGLQSGYENGHKSGLEEGKEKGKEENQKQIIHNMLKKQMSISDISEIVNLSQEKVLEIIHNFKEKN